MNASLDVQASALRAINAAKHSSAGKKFRTEIDVHHARTGRYVRTLVVYSVDELSPGQIGAHVLRAKGSISASVSRSEAI